MERLPDIIVLDFCIWLSERVKYSNRNNNESELLIDALAPEQLSLYADLYLRRRYYDHGDYCFSVRSIVEGFLSSEEFHTLESNPEYLKNFWDYRLSSQNKHYRKPDYDMRVRFAIEEAFHLYLLRNFEFICDKGVRRNNISPYHLAECTLNYLMNASDSEAKDAQVLNFMTKTRNEIADELNFIEWVIQRESNIPFETMPPEIFIQLLDEYAQETRAGAKKVEKLKRDYYNTGWAAVFARIQRCFMLEGKRPQRSLAYVMGRYLSNRVQYNCLILPLANKEGRKQFSKLVKDEWQNLNDLSGDALDIYYSESDIGKTGYDIAKRIQSLPDALRETAPSIVLWKDKIAEARALSIEGLNAAQIRNTIKTIVQQIKAGADIDTMIQEAEKTVKKQEALNYGATYNEFSGGKNVVVTGNTGNTFVNQGDDAEFGDITMGNTVNKDTCEFLHEIEEAICAIKNSNEIEAESKEQLVSIMEDAKQAETENSDEKRSMAKKAFGYVKGFLVKSAPVLISTLANLTKIAGFFGLSV